MFHASPWPCFLFVVKASRVYDRPATTHRIQWDFPRHDFSRTNFLTDYSNDKRQVFFRGAVQEMPAYLWNRADSTGGDEKKYKEVD
jgi:hypothetical protein